MGNHRFRLSDMIPNAWFYKLRDMSSKTRNQQSSKNNKNQNHIQNQTHIFRKPNTISQHHRQSYYYNREFSGNNNCYNNSPANSKSSTSSRFLDPPRRSSRRKSTRKTVYKPSPREMTASAPASAVCTCGGEDYFGNNSPFAEFHDLFESPTSEFDSGAGNVNGIGSWSSPCSSSATDIVFDMNQKSELGKLDGYDPTSELDLPPIITKHARKSRNRGNSREEAIEARNKMINEQGAKARSRKSFSQSNGVKLRVNSPRIGNRKIQTQSGRKSRVSPEKRSKPQKQSFSGSFAVVKASFDPEKDFRESMMEMIVENNIKASKDLEELLACYLSLNSDEYHALIIKAFQQIWFNLYDLHV